MVAELTASQQRSQDPTLVASLSFPALLDKLPLSLPVPADTPSSPKTHYRSQYTYLGYQDLLDPAVWVDLSPFDLALRLIDFSSLEPSLAQIVYASSAKGHVPFHPVSMFLLRSWCILEKWHRTEAIRKLAAARYDDYRQRFGFIKGVYPTEGGLRDFETRLGSTDGNNLIAQTVELACSIQIISQQAIRDGILSTDGMIHDAASRMRCSSVDDACYQPAPRRCRAKEEKGRRGCDCAEMACAQVCKHATPRDPKARFIVYKGHNQSDGPNAPSTNSGENKSPQGEPRYGYRTPVVRLVDRVQRDSLVLAHVLLGANASEDQAATELMEEGVARFNWVSWQFAVADAGEGREPFLSAAYQLGLRRVVGLRRAPGDTDAQQWAIRGYDDRGIPVCPFGYRLHPNGWDAERRRLKWCCRRTCEREKEHPAPDCPHRFDGDKHGLVRDVGRAFPDGSTRLVRDVPYGSPFAKMLYARARNAAEERNSEFEDLGLKRMPVYGWERVQAMVTVVDVWVNLKTIVRLIREAVLAANGLSPP
ncbi:MAG: hypothetical protein M0T85_06740 [Dehalococcoidales bacterium]|nr:hypothetical protein [Dehalococcoidales bacterium]